MKVCLNCGRHYPDDTWYCAGCGSQLELLPAPAPDLRDPDRTLGRELAHIEPDRRYPYLGFIAVLLVLAGIFMIVFGLFGSTVIYNQLDTPVVYQPVDSMGYKSPPITSNGTALLAAMCFSAISSILGISLVANGELIFLMINIQANTSVMSQTISILARALSKG